MACMTTGEVKNCVEGGAFGRVVFLGREQGFQLVAEGLPAGVLVAAGDRIGEERQGHGPEAAEAGEGLPLVGGGGRCSRSIGLQGADGGDDVAGLGFLAAGDGGGAVVVSVPSMMGSPPGVSGPASRGLCRSEQTAGTACPPAASAAGAAASGETEGSPSGNHRLKAFVRLRRAAAVASRRKAPAGLEPKERGDRRGNPAGRSPWRRRLAAAAGRTIGSRGWPRAAFTRAAYVGGGSSSPRRGKAAPLRPLGDAEGKRSRRSCDRQLQGFAAIWLGSLPGLAWLSWSFHASWLAFSSIA